MRILLFSLLVYQSSVGAIDTLRLSAQKENLNIEELDGTYFEYIKLPKGSTLDYAIQAFKIPGGSPFKKKLIKADGKNIWIRCIIKNESKSLGRWFLSIANPHLDTVAVFNVSGKNLLFHAGESLSFSTRSVLDRNFRIPLELAGSEFLEILIHIEKTSVSYLIPISIGSEKSFAQEIAQDYVVFGIYFGSVLIILCYAFSLSFVLKSKVYLYYSLSVLVYGLFNFSQLGLAFQFLFPNYPDLAGKFNFTFSFLLFPVWALFTNEFLKIKLESPRSWWIIKSISAISLIGIVLVFFFREELLDSSRFFFPPLLLLLLVGIFVFFIEGFRFYKKNRRDSLFYLASIIIVLVCGLINSVRLLGYDLLPYLKQPVLIGSIAEAIVMLIALSWQTKQVYDDRSSLNDKIRNQQRQLFKAFAEGVDKERSRVSGELHDNIGSRMANLKRFLTGNESIALEGQIDILCDELRNLSHQLSPHSIALRGLKESIIRLASDAEQTVKANFQVQFYNLENIKNEEIEFHVFRIVQEAIQNIIKHSNATEVDIQLVGHHEYLIITVEDNGQGFDFSKVKEGIGLMNIRTRVEGLGGQLELDSGNRQGTALIAKIPIQ